MEELRVTIGDKVIIANLYDDMFDFVRDADLSQCTITDGEVRNVPFIETVRPAELPEFEIFGLQQIVTKGETYIRVQFGEEIEIPTYMHRNVIEDEVYLIYDSGDHKRGYFTDGKVYEIYDDAECDIEFDYNNLSDDEFDDILYDLIDDEGARSLLDIEGVYELVKEHYNNYVLSIWEDKQKEQLKKNKE